RWPGTRGCIRRARTAASVSGHRPAGHGRSRSTTPHWDEPLQADGCHCRNAAAVACDGGCSSPSGATCVVPATHPGSAMPPSDDNRTAARFARPSAAFDPSRDPWPAASVHSSPPDGLAPGNGTPCAARCPGESGAPAPRVAPTGSSFFSAELLQSIDHQHLLSHQPLELGVLRFQFLQAAGIGHLHAAVLVPPAVKRLLRDVVLAAHLPDRNFVRLGFPQDPDDLFFAVSLLHGVLLASKGKRTHLPTGYTFRLRSARIAKKA